MLTLPTTYKGMAKLQPGRGVKLHYLYYWSDAFLDPEADGTQVPVRYDPFDAGIAYAFIKKRWARCISEHHARFAGRSEREIQLASAELRRRQQRHGQHLQITGRQLADFLASVEAEEVVLEQRLRDAQARTVVEPLFVNPALDTSVVTALKTGTIHVLVGTYGLLGLTNLSAQLSRRSVEIHFGRYRADLDKDRQEFKSVVLTFQRHRPLVEERDLVRSWEVLYEGSLGCVGVLKNWLNRALADALAHARPHSRVGTWTGMPCQREHCSTWRGRLRRAKRALREDPRGTRATALILGLPASSGRTGNGEINRAATPERGTIRPRRRTGRVARRPIRDPVAVE